MYQRGSQWTDLREIWYWGLSRKYVDEIQTWLKCDIAVALLSVVFIGNSGKQLNNTRRTYSLISTEKKFTLKHPDVTL
jgi:hypothetical protein